MLEITCPCIVRMTAALTPQACIDHLPWASLVVMARLLGPDRPPKGLNDIERALNDGLAITLVGQAMLLPRGQAT